MNTRNIALSFQLQPAVEDPVLSNDSIDQGFLLSMTATLLEVGHVSSYHIFLVTSRTSFDVQSITSGRAVNPSLRKFQD